MRLGSNNSKCEGCEKGERKHERKHEETGKDSKAKGIQKNSQHGNKIKIKYVHIPGTV